MKALSNEMIFVIGVVITGITLIGGLIYLFIYKIKRERLKNKLDQEYGSE